MPQYCLIKHRIENVTIDGDDPDRNPDRIPATGTITFEPILQKGDSVTITENGKTTTLTLSQIEASITQGEIWHKGEPGIKIFAGGDDTNPERIRYKATFSNMQAGGKKIELKPILFEAIPGGELQLSVAQPIPGAPYPGYSASIEQALGRISTELSRTLDHIDATAANVISNVRQQNSLPRIEALEAMGELSPESPVDGQTANLISQPDTLTRSAVLEAGDTRFANKHADIRPSLTTYETHIEPYRTVQFQDGHTVWALNTEGANEAYIERSSDWGETWERTGRAPFGVSTLTVLKSGTMLIFEGVSVVTLGAGARVARSTDNGETWQEVFTTQFPPFARGRGVCEGTDGSVIITEYGNVNDIKYKAYHSADDGQTWTVTLESPAVENWGDVGHIHSVVYDPYEGCHVLFMDLPNTAEWGPYIYRSDDNGRTWDLIGMSTGSYTPNWVQPMFFENYIGWGTDNERNGLIGRIKREDFYAGHFDRTEDSAIINLKSIYYAFPIRLGVWLVTVASETIMRANAPGAPGNWGHEVYIVSNDGKTVTGGFTHMPPGDPLGVYSNSKPYLPGYHFDALDHDGMTYVNIMTSWPRSRAALPVSQDWKAPMHQIDSGGASSIVVPNVVPISHRKRDGTRVGTMSMTALDRLEWTRDDVPVASRPEIRLDPDGVIRFRQGGAQVAYIRDKKLVAFNTLELSPNGVGISAGNGSPEGKTTAPPGSLYVNWSASRGTGLWVKAGGTGDTGWEPAGNPSGGTAVRPVNPPVGLSYFDTTLGKPIWWNGTTWVDATGTDADAPPEEEIPEAE